MIKQRKKRGTDVDDNIKQDKNHNSNDILDNILDKADKAQTFEEQARYIMEYLKEKGDDWYAPGRYGGMYLKSHHQTATENTLSKLFDE